MSATGPETGTGRARGLAALGDRRMLAMLLLAFAAGLPYGAVLGSLNAWLTREGITPSTIGTLSLLSLGYAFKYLWAPAFQTARPFPGLGRVGARRSWLIVLQLAMSLLVGLLALSRPAENIAFVALISLLVSLISPTHDLILDAWRIEVARDDADRDGMSALYQFGYKSAGFVTGFFALIMAERIGWVGVYIMIAGFILLSASGTLIAPEPGRSGSAQRGPRPSYFHALDRRVSLAATAIVALGWAVGFGLIADFVIRSLIAEKPVSGSLFVATQGPLIVLLTVILPGAAAAFLAFSFRATPGEAAASGHESPAGMLSRSLFQAIFDPLMDLAVRLRWAAILVVALALTYRFTDAVWGSFAYPFYLGTTHGALGHSLDDVGIASKFFGVIATILGSGLGAVLIVRFGRMPVFFVGAIIAAATNLLYADLAAGARVLDAFLALTRADLPLRALADWAATLSPHATPPDQGQRMARLMVTIFAENIAGGFALVAMTAYLTSVVNPRFAAVQYALLASLTMLIGTLGKPYLGDMIERDGYYAVFILTFWLGGVAVVLAAMEWLRQAREARRPSGA